MCHLNWLNEKSYLRSRRRMSRLVARLDPGFPQRIATVMMVLILAGATAEAENGKQFQRRRSQEQDENNDQGGGDSACLKGLLNALTPSARLSSKSSLVSTWSPEALASPCSHTRTLAGITCNNMSRVASIWLPSANLVGVLPCSLSLCSSLTTLNMSGNSFTGPIPTSLGDLPYLSTLSLSDNQLSGPIPVELSTCFALSFLDLRHNGLSGSIPGQLGLLPLQYFNVSYNRLSGLIPSTLSNTSTGAPRFNSYSFDHNPNLYGYPLMDNKEMTLQATSGSSSIANDSTVLYAVIIALGVVGLGVVLCLVVGLYWAARKWRKELAEREQRQQRRGNVEDACCDMNQEEDGWKQILTQL